MFKDISDVPKDKGAYRFVSVSGPESYQQTGVSSYEYDSRDCEEEQQL
jgi:hypothetical protein